MSGCAEPSAVLTLPRTFQLSPTKPSSMLSSPSSSTSLSSTAGRRTIISTVPTSAGAIRMYARPASSSVVAKCIIGVIMVDFAGTLTI